MIGQEFGKWKVIAATDKTATTRKLKIWICQCQCGTTKTVSQESLRAGKSKSCGCTNPWREWKGNPEHAR